MSTRTEDVHSSYNKVVDSNRDIDDDDNMPRSTVFRSGVQLMISFMSGMVFGLAAEKGRVFEPHIIREQMLFTNFTMLKMFLTASAVGMMGFSFLSMIPATLDHFESVVDDFLVSLMTKSVTSAAVGGALLGCGMTLSGACPGMVLAQLGAGVPSAVFTVAGGLCGAYLYALTEPIVYRNLHPRKPYRYYTLDEFLGSPYVIIALPVAAMLGMVVFAVEVARPWTSEVEQSGSSLMESRAWPPFVAGMLIGLLQVPTVLSLRTTLGSTTGYMTVASQALALKPLQSVFSYLKSFRRGVHNWWQVFYMGGAVFGAHLSAQASATIGSVSGVLPSHSFLGGIFMIYGARLAGGCSSGHGLSGMGLLMLLSLVAVPSMFAGGISTAVIMKYLLDIDM
ncbi:unnamed protein product [Candidula unifasciata]|uniref:Sulphur transport domain-containing protein n=1 Tax=Candidula unifasciata TaxID=100452 RepID=A0A8S3ZMD3_9EUPU|nr:unnamed protein product [Candidula unifasciata]